ncbi:hypothetical protein KKD03_03645, partial [Patescibacteria group bacterium]|nr:hypothetical protein [Patescibacteria group bacterium]
MKKILFSLIFVLLLNYSVKTDALFSSVNNVFAANEVEVAADSKVFTVKELAEFDGKDGHKSYTAYEGVVYDVTDSKLWKLGEHFGLNAGVDLTTKMAEAPHGDEVFAGFVVLGKLEGYQIPEDKDAETNETVVWYEKRIRIGSFSILGWTGIFLGIFFVLTFASCFALPWAKLPLPWKGSKIGPDPLDDADKHMTWSSVHK